MVSVLVELLLLTLDEDLLDGSALLATELELFSDELVTATELLTTEELTLREDLLELATITLDDDFEEAGIELDATDEATTAHKLPFTLGAPAVPLA